MLDPDNVPAVGPNERLSRFILTKRHVNQETKLPKADAFVPHPYDELSVTRDLDASEQEVWQAGHDVAQQRSKPLMGRCDVIAASYVGQKLKTVPDPVDGNPNHVNVALWPSDKPQQRLIALEIAAVATFVPTPTADLS
ncbi:hypothetical protein Enr13x_23560 [Stieleria neptunia]|uniref:RES domain protein n=1 Tax=Stieleria neptunia TaxID=2527979 RepID=A0A518HNT7_9BACT|nr:hypothetical protein [Stieleria neptunia]QDV42508.1 hypothetical protein Enr13x_23560 [Stieleria neptunia]